jgi:5-methylcytosine-specific restriction endonuclease McrA
VARPRFEYAKKLRDPRWQRRRLEILDRDTWACRYCGATEEELHVHHVFYRKGREPWEYDGEDLVTLCATCHQETTATVARITEAVSRLATENREAASQLSDAIEWSACWENGYADIGSHLHEFQRPERDAEHDAALAAWKARDR